MRNRGPFRQQWIGEAASLERIVRIKGRVKEKLALSFFADDKSGLIVADFDNVRSAHVFSLTSISWRPRMSQKRKKVLSGSLAQQEQQHRDMQRNRLRDTRGERWSQRVFSMAVSIGGAHECVVELSV
jgi:hypothetical protein